MIKGDGIKLSIDSAVIKEVYESLFSVMHDLEEHCRVAKYNLYGECCGERMPKPSKPMLVHESGLRESEAVLKEANKMWLGLHQILIDNGISTRYNEVEEEK
jgi:hypothetical protein